MPSSETIGRHRPLRLPVRPTHAVALLAVLTIAAIVASVGVLLWQLRERDQAHALHETESAARMLLEQTAQALEGPDMALIGVQERLETPFGRGLGLEGEAVHLMLVARAHGMRPLKALFLIDRDGRVVNSSLGYPAPALSAAERDYYRVFAEGRVQGLFVDRAMRSLASGGWTMHLARRLDDANGNFRGVAVAALDLSYFEQMFSHLKIDFDRPSALYTVDGTLVASLPHREADLGDQATELSGVGLPQKDGELRSIERLQRDGSTLHFALGRVDGFPLMASVTNDEIETLADWRENAVMIAMSALLVVTFVAAAAVTLVAQLRRDEHLSRALREADDRFQQTIETVMDAIVSVDDEHRIVIFNQAAERMFGMHAAEVIGLPLGALLTDDARRVHDDHMDHFLEQVGDARTMAPQMEIRGRRADGVEFPIESTISKTTIRGRLQMTAVLRDITERRRAEADLRELNQELRRLSVALQSVREEERERISRELHDELGQQLTGIKLDLSWLTLRTKEGRQPAPETLEGMREKLDTAIVSVRRISSELRPRILDELGFAEAVSWQATEFARRSGIEVALDLKAGSLVKRTDVATALFRIVQESLTNVARHAGARHVRIELSNDDSRLYLRVEDDGQGLSPGERHGIGLLSMRERANALGGTFSVSTGPGGGAVVEVSVPLVVPEADADREAEEEAS